MTKKYFFLFLLVTYIILGWGSFSTLRGIRNKVKEFFVIMMDEAERQIKIKDKDE